MLLVQSAFEILFFACAAGVLYTYALYPAILYPLSRLFGRSSVAPRLDDAALPSITLLIAAHDEQAVIEGRVRNALALDYPRDRMQIVIASDGSTDRTNEIVRQFADQGVELFDYSVRRGKAAVLNIAMRHVRGEIVLLSDANTHTQPDAARALVRWFDDPQVGAVCGKLVLTDAQGGNNADGLYWRYETFLKRQESRLGALLGSNGAIYAIRKEQFVPIPNNTIIDDFVIPLEVRLRHGSRIVYDESAVAHEESSENMHAEYRRRARIGAGGWQAIGLLWRLLDPRQGWIAFTFLSHKVLRWICPFLMLGALAANLILCGSRFYMDLFIAQSAFYALAGCGQFATGSSRPARLARLPAMFVAMNAALLMGFLRWLQGPQSGMWARTRRPKEVHAGMSDLSGTGLGGAGGGSPWRVLTRRDILVVAATVCAAMLALAGTWINLFTVSYIDEELNYVLMTPVMMAWLVWVRRDELRGCRARPAWFGLPILLFGWLVHWYGFNYDPAIWRAGAVIVAVGAFIMAAGRDVCARMAPALAAAVFLIPIDPTGRYHFAGPLEVVTAQATQSVCDILGMTVERSGNLLSVNGMDVAVAEACNGMRMVLSLFLACYVVAFTYSFKPGVRFLLLAASPLVAILSNVVRLVPTVWMFGHASRQVAEEFHAVSGWVMTMFAFVFLMALTQLFRVLWDTVAAIELSPSEADSSLLPGGLSAGVGS
jgi:exosortase